MEIKVFFSIRNHHKGLSQLFLLHLNTYVMEPRPLEIFYCGDLLYTPDLYRRQILAFKINPICIYNNRRQITRYSNEAEKAK